MIRHLLKLVWRRKRINALLMVEIFFSFLVVFAVATASIYVWDNYGRPLGFEHADLWDVRIDVEQRADHDWNAQQVEVFGNLIRVARAFPGAVAVAGAQDVPYDGSTSNYGYEVDGNVLYYQVSEVTDGFAEVVGLNVVAGRWFEEGDRVRPWEPLVINRNLARLLFGDEEAIGQTTPFRVGGRDARIVGVVSDYRKNGEFSAPVPYMFRRIRVDDPESRPPRNILLKMAAGTDPAGEEVLVERLQAVARDYSFELRIISEMRETNTRLTLAPLIGAAVVAGFLLVMVGLGLIGVLWQNVTQRTREIGLRRAAGASARSVKRQILGELWILTTLGLALGVVVLVQLPILDLVGFLPSSVFAKGVVVACGLVYGLATLSGLYPSWLATRVHPAEALHYE